MAQVAMSRVAASGSLPVRTVRNLKAKGPLPRPETRIECLNSPCSLHRSPRSGVLRRLLARVGKSRPAAGRTAADEIAGRSESATVGAGANDGFGDAGCKSLGDGPASHGSCACENHGVAPSGVSLTGTSLRLVTLYCEKQGGTTARESIRPKRRSGEGPRRRSRSTAPIVRDPAPSTPPCPTCAPSKAQCSGLTCLPRSGRRSRPAYAGVRRNHHLDAVRPFSLAFGTLRPSVPERQAMAITPSVSRLTCALTWVGARFLHWSHELSGPYAPNSSAARKIEGPSVESDYIPKV